METLETEHGKIKNRDEEMQVEEWKKSESKVGRWLEKMRILAFDRDGRLQSSTGREEEVRMSKVC